ncbi:sensor histidine kinase [Streptomyces beijiangensis]|uniref:histidine kinase n=1 Tax=Streptomyces beijiangensis TaxID=163361 RepID=A0A939F913_9ACTN|nr:sensor histidine kinase [Streptomyces beijiangensis]MBO0513956.1 sensor histidine kinase [Streptomyces beijiangensis]
MVTNDDSVHGTEPGHLPHADSDFLSGHPLVAWGARVGQRMRQADRRHPWGLDTAVVVCAFLLLCVPDLVHRKGPDEIRIQFTHLPVAGILALQAGLVLPLLFRRRNPTAAFTVILAVFLVQWSLGAWLRADAALLVALYSLVLHGRLRHLPWACAATAVALCLVALQFSGAVSTPDALFFLFSAAVAAVALGFAVRIRRAQLAGLRDRAARLEIERDQRSRLAAITERARVAREMHDIVGHNLSVIITLADGGAYAVDASPERGKQALVLIGDTGRTALGELRRMLGALRERTDGLQLAPQPGVGDLEALFTRVRAAGPRVEYHSVGESDALDRGLQLMVYRIVQEALTNTLKHAGPRARAHVTLRVDPGQLHLRVQDSGPPEGSGRPRPPRAEGHGLAGMTERAALYGGTLTAGPGPGAGWTVEAVLDLTPLPDPSGTTT